MARNKFNALPGFGLTMGFTMFYLSVIVLIPLAGLFLRVSEAGWRSQDFNGKDFKDSGGLIRQLREQADPVSQFLWNRFSEASRRVLSVYEPGAPGEPEAERVLTAELNQVLQGASLHREIAFTEVNLPIEAQRLAAGEVIDRRAVRMNRLALEAAYPDAISHRESWFDYWHLATSRRALAAYRLTFGASFVAAVANVVFGTLIAWVLVRYEFPGRRFIDALIDIPFALPTAVAGLTLANLFAENGWLGQWLVPLGIKGAFTPLGVIIALTFVGMPFAVRTLQPVLESLEPEVEEVSATLGAGRLRTFVSVIAPALLPPSLTGFALAFARAIGEYGSVVFISSNAPFEGEIAPYLIWMRIDQFDYTGAIALAVVLLVVSFVLLAAINLLEHWASRFQR